MRPATLNWDFVHRFSAPRAPVPRWDGTCQLLEAGVVLARAHAPELRAALATWEARLADLGGEPLCQDWSRFRPLRLSREEDWSDWLAHLIETSRTGLLASMLFSRDPERCRGARVEREVVVDDFRLDLQIRWLDGEYAQVEVKVGDQAVEKTQPGAEAHRRYIGDAACADFILLPREDLPLWNSTPRCEAGARVAAITWHDVARAIRRALVCEAPEPTAWRAWAVAFLGAIHQRILGHSRVDPTRAERLGVDLAGLLEILEETPR